MMEVVAYQCCQMRGLIPPKKFKLLKTPHLQLTPPSNPPHLHLTPIQISHYLYPMLHLKISHLPFTFLL